MTLEDRIARYLDKIPGAISGSDGHGQTFTVACTLVNGFALDADTALRHLTAYNAKCSPLWTPRELRHKVNQAEKATPTRPRGHLLGTEDDRRPEAVQGGPKAVPVRLTAKKRQFRTGRTVLFNFPTYTGEKKESPLYIRVGDLGASEASEEGASVETIPLEDFGAVRVPGCSMSRPEEILCSDATWRSLNVHPLGGEPLVHLALSLFGPDATILSTNEAQCA